MSFEDIEVSGTEDHRYLPKEQDVRKPSCPHHQTHLPTQLASPLPADNLPLRLPARPPASCANTYHLRQLTPPSHSSDKAPAQYLNAPTWDYVAMARGLVSVVAMLKSARHRASRRVGLQTPMSSPRYAHARQVRLCCAVVSHSEKQRGFWP